MKAIKIKTNNSNAKYSIIIGNNILNSLHQEIKKLCPMTKKIGLIIDINIPGKFKKKIKDTLKNYKIYTYEINPSEKIKSLKTASNLVEKLLLKKFNRSDTIIGMGGGVIGDVSSFVASITKRGINFINVPTTLLAQVDSSIGGKTGVNSNLGKNLIGSFYQPKLVVTDVSLLNSLKKRELICGFAEILKHSIIRDYSFFKWIQKNSKKILVDRNNDCLIYAIKKSCKIKLNIVNQDLKEKNLRMILNFGHTFAHAIEAKNKFSKKINHGEAVLMGMILATKLSFVKKICSKKTLDELLILYKINNLNYSIDKNITLSKFVELFKLMQNNDEKINFILLKKIGQTTRPENYKMSISDLTKSFQKLLNMNL